MGTLVVRRVFAVVFSLASSSGKPCKPPIRPTEANIHPKMLILKLYMKHVMYP